jgi:16S rRNA (uracil1498-N3)-methyltransferase
VDAIRGGAAELHGDDARHLTRVLRVEPGQKFEISDQRAAWLAEVTEARGERVLFHVLEPLETVEMPVRIALYAALIKFDRFEWMIEKATELGVESIHPFEAVRSEKGLVEASRKRLDRWQRIAREAGQQSRRLRAPEFPPAVRWQAAIAEPASVRLLLEESGAAPLLSTLPGERPPGDPVALLVGPEGGWTEAERQEAAAAGWVAASLGPQILRAETAAIAGIAVLAAAWLP